MEKGNSRNSSSAKSITGDSKPKQDVTNKFLRLPRYKESVSPRPESRRKPNPQRNRELFDKRPRNKTGVVYEKYRSEIAENSASDSYAKFGSRKVNLNHLLNFTVAPIDNREVVGRPINNRCKIPKYNKELFLQANCQFVVKEHGDYAVHLQNPDILVEWPLIEEILLPTYEVPLCPICLYTPVAAKITRCGHVYCWPCMLHYLALTDRTWQKCPICFDAVHKTELKSVSLKLSTSFNVGNQITMRLMKRDRGSLLPIPASNLPLQLLCNMDYDNTVTRFQKLLLANKSQMLDIIKREHCELMEAYMKEKDTPEACFIEEALKLLSEKEKSLKNEFRAVDNGNELPANEEYNLLGKVSPIDITDMLPRRQYTISQSSVDTQESSPDDICDNDLNTVAASPNYLQTDSSINSQLGKNHETGKKDSCYFYQAEDGQHIFLHNINIRMIIKEYGSLENAPEMINATIVETERVSMTDVLRKRLRYLKHLPLTCEFQVVELNFSSVLSKQTMQQFEGEINKRKHFRNRKARDERRREKYIEQEENKKLGKYPRATYNLKSADQFPVFDSQADFQPLVLQNSGSEKLDFCEKLETIGHEMNNLSFVDHSDGSGSVASHTASFAQMLKDGHAKAHVRVSKPERKFEYVQQTQDISEDEDWVPPPEYHQSFSDAIQIALDSAISENNQTTEDQKSSKKKKNKKRLLFTTSMCRNK